MRVELDLFSGRQNFAWQLTADEARHFDAILTRLPTQADAPPPLFEGLGYRGFKITDPDQSRHYIVQGRAVVVDGQEGRQFLIDENRQLERHLMETARNHLEFDLYAFLLEQSGFD